RANMTDEMEANYLAALDQALTIGETILKEGGSSLDAIQQTIMFLEDTPYFNAGKGAVFTNSGTNELDASIMDGRTQNAGAVGGVTNIKNPIIAARAVMEKSEHVMLTGKGAEQFAEGQGIETVNPEYYFTQQRWEALQRVKARETPAEELSESDRHGTVGAVALDMQGNLAAGTSTGGMTNKRFNRVGDAPIIGAGTYADNATCAISSTGHGEYFIRYAVAHDIAARMEYKGISLSKAADEVVMQKLVEKGGSGGIIGVDRYGNVALTFNSEGMYRGFVTPSQREVNIYRD
ncbi:MAG: isoaspartyl peptidase/L-asparaginase, partial [Saprospiraceae bacterium]|nr:isoaspartyl peptidase/L-asparaginase [Saprospiraceae bacterium]